MALSSTWYVDFEAYHYRNCYIVKELAILNKDTLECHDYLVLSPSSIEAPPCTPSIHFQYHRHNLKWEDGYVHFSDVLRAVKHHVMRGDVVYAKGPQKVVFLRQWIPQIKDMTWLNTPFKKLYNCINEVCDKKHGLNCARRKVHELRYVDCMHKC
jgi:hypothetical protein